MAPPSGCNLICKNPPLQDQHNQSEPRGVSEKCQSFSSMLAVPLPPTGAVSALTWSDKLKLKLKHAPLLPTSKRRLKKTEEEKQCKNKELDRAREKTRINIRGSFQRWRSCGICKDSRATQSWRLFCWTGKDPCFIDVSFCVLTTRLWWR